ncbi:DUF2173 family protein [Ectothiorhodospiraceae bacterium 2226]|nr:DUF2173 family protein [Ectothiorhodospiraceae bacterium 2226]
MDQLIALPGVVAAFAFSDRGELTEAKRRGECPLDDRKLDLLSHLCVANLAVATMQARGWGTLTQSADYYPVEAVTLIGDKWSAMASPTHGVLLDTSQADFDAAYDALTG